MMNIVKRLWNSSLFFLVLACLCMGCITYLSSRKRSELTITRTIYNLPRQVAVWASDTDHPAGIWDRIYHINYANILDKPLHFLEFAVLTFLWWRCFFCVKSVPIQMRAVWFAILITFFFGCLDEFHQFFVPGREFRLVDLAANTFGILFCGAVIEFKLRRNRRMYYTGDEQE